MDKPIKQGTVCFLLKDNQIFLMRVEYPNGKQVWSGVGGMRDNDESLEDTVIREGNEELNFTILKDSLQKVAIIQENPHFQLIVFTATAWEGTPEISETEIKELHWFDIAEIPYEMMWPDNKFWLPKILEGKQLSAIVHKNAYAGELTGSDITIHVKSLL